jgi:hypothetical protein
MNVSYALVPSSVLFEGQVFFFLTFVGMFVVIFILLGCGFHVFFHVLYLL